MTTPPGARLARALTIAGQVIDPQWHRAVLAVDRARFVPDTVWATSTAKRAGPRDLRAEIGAVWEEWTRWGKPGRDQLGVTVDQEGTRLWADAPAGVLRPLGTAAAAG